MLEVWALEFAVFTWLPCIVLTEWNMKESRNDVIDLKRVSLNRAPIKLMHPSKFHLAILQRVGMLPEVCFWEVLSSVDRPDSWFLHHALDLDHLTHGNSLVLIDIQNVLTSSGLWRSSIKYHQHTRSLSDSPVPKVSMQITFTATHIRRHSNFIARFHWNKHTLCDTDIGRSLMFYTLAIATIWSTLRHFRSKFSVVLALRFLRPAFLPAFGFTIKSQDVYSVGWFISWPCINQSDSAHCREDLLDSLHLLDNQWEPICVFTD